MPTIRTHKIDAIVRILGDLTPYEIETALRLEAIRRRRIALDTPASGARSAVGADALEAGAETIRDRMPDDGPIVRSRAPYCVICHEEPVDAENGIDTCPACIRGA